MKRFSKALLCLSTLALVSCANPIISNSSQESSSSSYFNEETKNNFFSIFDYISQIDATHVSNRVIRLANKDGLFDYCFNNASYDETSTSIKVEKGGSLYNLDGFIGISKLTISYRCNGMTSLELIEEGKSSIQSLSSSNDYFKEITLNFKSNPSVLKIIANDTLYIKKLEIEYTGGLDLSKQASSITLSKIKNEFEIGSALNINNDISVFAILPSSNTYLPSDETGLNGFIIEGKDEEGKAIDLTKPFSKEGKITLKARYRSLESNSIEVTIKPKQIVLATSISISPSSKEIAFGEEFNLVPTISPENTTDKTVTFVSSNTDVATVNANGVIKGISEGSATITATCNNVSATCEVKVIKASGYYIGNVKADTSIIDPYYAPSKGNQKLLFIPIKLANATYSWSQSYLDQIEENIDTIASYYKTASLGKLSLTGGVAGSMSKMYSSSYKESDFDGDDGYTKLEEVMNASVKWVANNFKDINLSDYDTNSDGYLDSVHFVFNGYTEDWGNALWPHMSTLDNNPGTNSLPTIRSYSATSIGFMDDAYTTIHEQGHIFGLEDYYDYSSGSTISCLGGADMQDYNVFDWNSFSKLEMGWVNPYVIDGSRQEVTLTIKSAATSGDCILLAPSWNQTAFDEYILIELFTKSGNNTKDWSSWSSEYNNLGNGGIRLYHVDARLWGYNSESSFNNGGFVDDIDNNKYKYLQLANHNTSNNNEYATIKPSVIANKGYRLLHLIQAGNKNTFEVASKNPGKSQLLKKADLFSTGDTFSIGSHTGYTNYGTNFFKNKTTLNNGEAFPYVISFDEVTTTSATITISKC